MAETTSTVMPDSVGAYLVAQGSIDGTALDRANRLSATTGERVDAVISKLGLVSDDLFARAVSAVFDLPLLNEDAFPDHPILSDQTNTRFLRDRRVLPVAFDNDQLILAMADPGDIEALESMALLAGRPVRVRVSPAGTLDRVLERLYDRPETTIDDPVFDAPSADDLAGDVERLKDLASEAPVVRFVNDLVARAVDQRASDIHLEPTERGLRVRYRVDGELRDDTPAASSLTAPILSRIKILAGLDIAERRRPQDGRIRTHVRAAPLDLRIATFPALHGESVAIRVLAPDPTVGSLDALRLPPHTYEALGRACQQAHGLVLVTGPTGSGKTTTLYAALREINQPNRKIITVEDPVEYQLAGVTQSQVNAAAGLSFAGVLRAMVRQDPDVLLVGEIRDIETARIAMQAALTGHLVLSTLHTNDAASTLTRLTEMGLESYLVAATLRAVAAQRLVRQLCPACRVPRNLPRETCLELGLCDGDTAPLIYAAVGCSACGYTGYKGRIAIMEVLEVTTRLQRLVLAQAGATELYDAALDEGMVPLYSDGLARVVAGETTLEEVFRVTKPL